MGLVTFGALFLGSWATGVHVDSGPVWVGCAPLAGIPDDPHPPTLCGMAYGFDASWSIYVPSPN